MKKILVVGATGYLGSHIVKTLMAQNADFQALARNAAKLVNIGLAPKQIIEAQVTAPSTLSGCCEGVDVIISALGITRQKDGLTHMDVDYQANKNLLDEAIKSGVKKFIYVSVLHGESMKHLNICKAKERFVQELERSGLEYCIIRPSGFFSDMAEFYEMAKKGRVYLFGDGHIKANPIHGEDLAKVCIDAIHQNQEVIEVGGPEVLSHRELAAIAFEVLGKKTRITYIPDWIRKLILRLSSIFLSKAQYSPLEFFLNVMAMDMSTNRYGQYTIKSFFHQLNQSVP